MNLEDPSDKLAVLGLVLLLAVGLPVWQLKTSEIASQSFTDCFYEAPRVPFYPKMATYGSLIDCLAENESSNNPDVINPDDVGSPSYGLLQFKKATFQRFCVDKYGYVDDIMNPEIQKNCCAEMLEDGYQSAWTTYDFCN